MTNTPHPRRHRLPDGPPDLSGRVVVIDVEGRGYHDDGRCSVCEIAAVELAAGRRTGRVYHTHLDPQGTISRQALAVHGLTREFLTGKPLFASVAPDFLDFLGEAVLVAHGAGSDRSLLDHDLAAVERQPFAKGRFACTALMALRLLGATYSLDGLCDRLGVDRRARAGGHAALIDAELTADCLLRLAALPGYAAIRGVRPIQADGPKRDEAVECTIDGTLVRFVVTDRATGEIREVTAPLPPHPPSHEAAAGPDGYLRVTRRGGRAPDNPEGAALLSVLNGEVVSFAFENGRKVLL